MKRLYIFLGLDKKRNVLSLILWSLFSIIMLTAFCFIYDLWHTSNCSLAYLQGHILDFYDYNFNVRGTGTIVYYPTIYILFAIWNIPLHFLGIRDMNYSDAGCLLYSKGLGLVFLCLVYYYTYQLAKKIYKDEKAGKNAVVVLWCGIPIFFLFEFPWALYDTIWLAFMMGGTLHLLKGTKRDTIIAILFFALCATLKTFTLFVIIPILCYHFKKLIQLTLSCIGVMSLYALETLIYSGSEYFVNEVTSPLNGGFLFVALFTTRLGQASLVLTVFVIVSLFAFRTERCESNHLDGYLLFPFLAASLFIAFGQVTPGWTIIFLPFMAILIGRLELRDRIVFYLSNTLLSLGELLYILCTRGSFYGETTIAAGIFGKRIFGVNDAAYQVLDKFNEFLTTRILGTIDGAESEYLKYGHSFIFSTIVFSCILFGYKRLWYNQLSNPVEEISYNERLFMTALLVCICLIYVIPILIWTVQYR